MGAAYVPSSTELDDNLERVDSQLQLLEKEIVHEYRHLLAGARKGFNEVLRFPALSRAKFHHRLPALLTELEVSGGRSELSLVTEFHEALRLRLLVLEHLLEQDVPFAYLERAFRPILHTVRFVSKTEAESHTAAASNSAPAPTPKGCCHRLRHGFSLMFGHDQPVAAKKKDIPRHTLAVTERLSEMQRFNDLPDQLKHLFLLYHFMEQDELRLLKTSQRLPSLGSGFVLQGSIAVFEAEDRGEYHWHGRTAPPHTGKRATTVQELQEKLNRQGHEAGVKSRFHTNGHDESGREMTRAAAAIGKRHTSDAHSHSPEELRRKLQHHTAPTGVRADFLAERPPARQSSDPPWKGLEFTL